MGETRFFWMEGRERREGQCSMNREQGASGAASSRGHPLQPLALSDLESTAAQGAHVELSRPPLHPTGSGGNRSSERPWIG